jgi:hypothetical protein
VLVLGAGGVGGPGRQEIPQVRVLVRRLPVSRGDADDHHLPQARVRPGRQVGEAGLLARLPTGDGQRVALTRVAVPADLQPGLLPLVPAEQDPRGGRVDDQRGGGDVQGKLAPPRVAFGLGQGPDAPQVGIFGVALGAVTVEEFGQR